MSQTILVGMSGRGIQAWEAMGLAVRVAARLGTLVQISSVIRENPTPEDGEMLRAVATMVTDLDSRQIIIQMKTTVPSNEEHSPFDLLLLRYGDFFVMTPELTLPHPQLASDPRWLVSAAEVDPSWIHPVLGKTLLEMAEPIRFSSANDFYAQGETILAFLKPKT